jgi:arsenate reductase-like glutaredoxin family protein
MNEVLRMLDKIKDIGSQAVSMTSDALTGIATTVKDGVDTLSNTATSVTESLNEKAVKASTSQMYRILEIALQELEGRPLAERPVSLTASVNFGVAALEMQIHLNQSEAKPNAQIGRDGDEST